ncbi:agamous-like MADS-box protein AGL61 [Malania oleifera]|uniref:agamous-like MADS-box protein AGL61 n=1 Tax=Malania oleifera TaxID=397392 RepID=UPI0025AEA455|nr:agamous-like MADS-box protein AGL61 [Malania oleifera]
MEVVDVTGKTDDDELLFKSDHQPKEDWNLFMLNNLRSNLEYSMVSTSSSVVNQTIHRNVSNNSLPVQTMDNLKKKKTAGRRKVAMKKIEDKRKRQVTFSKRRQGLFKAASEVCVLYGVEIAIVAKSPGNNFFCFDHPNSDSVIDSYLASQGSPVVEGSPRPACGGSGGSWWEQPIDAMTLQELEEFQAELEQFQVELENLKQEALGI